MQKLTSVHLRAGSVPAERVGWGELGGVTHRVTCTWWLLGLAVQGPWLGPGRPIFALAAWTGLENATLREDYLGSERVFDKHEC